MRLVRRAFLALAATALVSAAPLEPPVVRIRLVTEAGNIMLALDARRAPKTVANFLLYIDDGRLEGASFYRAARRKSDPKFGFVQGGIGTDARTHPARAPARAHQPYGAEAPQRHHFDGARAGSQFSERQLLDHGGR